MHLVVLDFQINYCLTNLTFPKEVTVIYYPLYLL